MKACPMSVIITSLIARHKTVALVGVGALLAGVVIAALATPAPSMSILPAMPISVTVSAVPSPQPRYSTTASGQQIPTPTIPMSIDASYAEMSDGHHCVSSAIYNGALAEVSAQAGPDAPTLTVAYFEVRSPAIPCADFAATYNAIASKAHKSDVYLIAVSLQTLILHPKGSALAQQWAMDNIRAEMQKVRPH
jgi:hypothetical protein